MSSFAASYSQTTIIVERTQLMVKRYRHRPILIEAFQMKYEANAHLEWPTWFRDRFYRAPETFGAVFAHKNGLFVIQLETSLLEIPPDHWVVQHVESKHFGVLTPDEFARSYEPI